MTSPRLQAALYAATLTSALVAASGAWADVAPSLPTQSTPALQDAEAIARELPRSADAALNAGLAAAERDDLGNAVLWLERAALLAPLDREIEDALQAAHREARRVRAERFASGTLVEGEPPSLFWWRFLQAIGVGALATTLLACNALGFALLGAARRAAEGARRDVMHVAAALFRTAAAASAGIWSMREVLAVRVDPAIVLDAEPRGRAAPDELAPMRTQPELFAGAVVLVEEVRGPWRRVRLISDESVWLDASSIERIREP